MKKRVMLEKLSRDKQLEEDNLRRRHERRKEKELDERMVVQIEKELKEEKSLQV